MATEAGQKPRLLELNPLYWSYGIAAVAFGVKSHAFSYLLLIFSTNVLGLPGYLASIALAVAMLWDAVSDLLLGHWSDKTSTVIGRRHPFMYAALLVLPISFWAMFNPVIELTDEWKFAYVLVFSLLIRTGTTLFEVPSVAQLPELEKDYDRRNRWLTLRYVFAWYGGNGIHTINLFFWVGAYGMSVQTGYSIYAAGGATLIAASIIISSIGTQWHAAAQPRPTETFKLREITREILQIFDSLRNRNFLSLFVYGVTSGVASGLGAALYLYNTTYFFGFSGTQIAITGLAVFSAPLIAYALMPILGPILGKKRLAISALCGNIGLYPIPYILLLLGWWPAMGSNLSLAYYTIFIVAEVACSAIANVLLDSMMADIVEESEIDTSRRSEGLFYSARGFGSKAISAGGIVFAGTIVSLVGLGGLESAADMTMDARVHLALLFLPLYCGLNFVAISFISMYRIDRDEHAENLRTLAQRHETQT